MKDEFGNRQNMHHSVVGLLDKVPLQSGWKDQSPLIFTTRVAELRPKIIALTGLCAAQQAATTGFATDKDQEEQELENIAFDLGQALADWLEDHHRHGDAAPIDLSLSAWQVLRDDDLIGKAKLLHGLLSTALTDHAVELKTYGLEPADATALAKETADFAAIVADPTVAISRRKALTAALRPAFREVAELLAKMDRQVNRFRRTAPGAAFADAWEAARTIRDLGHSAPATPAPTPPTP